MPSPAATVTAMILTVLAIVALIALCLWLFFRRGSINDRAEVDMPLPDSD